MIDPIGSDRLHQVGGGIVKLWSELPFAFSREVAADTASVAWTVLWAAIALRIYMVLSGFAEAGRLVSHSGVNLRAAGADIGANMSTIPIVGGLGGVVESSITSAANPLVDFGSELETLIVVLAALISLLVLAVALIPWHSRYLPWRLARLRRLRAAHRVVRRTGVPPDAAEQLLAARAVYRLDYETLLAFSPDPFGDFLAGRHDRLARAELATAGLQLRR